MNKLILSLLLISIVVKGNPQTSDRSEIEQEFKVSYVNAVFINFNEQAIRDGFYKDFQLHFQMKSPTGSMIKKVSLDEWIKMVASMKFANIDYKILEIFQSGNAATTISEIYQDGKRLYTDYLIWQKIDNKWVIMGKTFDTNGK